MPQTSAHLATSALSCRAAAASARGPGAAPAAAAATALPADAPHPYSALGSSYGSSYGGGGYGAYGGGAYGGARLDVAATMGFTGQAIYLTPLEAWPCRTCCLMCHAVV